jgi:hypothetical protein
MRGVAQGEEVHDEVEDLISLEVEELQKGVNAIQKELDSTRATLAEMRVRSELALRTPQHGAALATGLAREVPQAPC